MTVVLSTGGWVRSAKGHEIDPRALSYKSGDGFQALARGRSLQPAVFIDSTGPHLHAAGALAAVGARGYGEPLSGRLDPPDGAKFAGVMIGEPEDLWLLASDAGYGFTVRLKELITDRRAGKTVLNVPENAHVLPPASVPSAGLAGRGRVSSEGKLLAFPVREVPEMPRGKGNKLYDIPGKKAAAREELHDRGRGRAAEGHAGAVGRRAEEDPRLARAARTTSASAPSAARCCKRGWPRKIERMEGLPPPPA